MNLLLLFMISGVNSLPPIYIFLRAFKQNITIKRSLLLFLVIVLEVICAVLSVKTVSYIPAFPYSRLIASFLTIFVVTLLIYLVTDLSIGQTIFISFLMINMLDITQLMIYASYPNPQMLAERLNWYYLARLTGFSALVMPFFYLFIKRQLEPLIRSTRAMPIWNYIYIIPMVFYTIYRLGICPGYFDQTYVWTPGVILLPLFWTFGTFAVYFLTVKSLTAIHTNTCLEDELHCAKLLAGAQEKQYHSLKVHIEEDRRIRHDFRHSLLALQGYAMKGDCESVLKHIQSYIEIMHIDSGAAICENPALNTILCHYREMAAKNDIQTTLSISLPAALPFSEPDLCVLTGNLFENAIEACLRQKDSPRVIKLSMQMTSPRILSMTIANSYEGKITEKNGRYFSSKRDDYGIGLSSIRHITEKYNGIMRINYTDKSFAVSIMLNT